MTVSELIELSVEFLSTQGLALVIRIAAATAIFFVGRWIAGFLVRLLGRIMTRAKVDTTLCKFAENLAYGALLVLVILAAVDKLGVDTTSFAAVIAATGLAIGLAMQDSLSNFASGVMLMLFKPFRVGDFVRAGGSAGIVEEIDIFHTIMRTGDNIRIIVPNGSITGGTIENLNAKPTRRIDLVVGCGYNDDLRAVKQFLEEALAEDERILEDPAPVVAVNELGASSVDLVVRPWVKTEDYWATRWDLTEKIKLGFDDRGFTIPYPSRDVYIHNEEGEAMEPASA